MLDFIFAILPFVVLFICKAQKKQNEIRQEPQVYLLIKRSAIFLDILILNVLLVLFSHILLKDINENSRIIYFVLSSVYIFCVFHKEPISVRKVYLKKIINYVFSLILYFVPLSLWTMHFMNQYVYSPIFALCFGGCLFLGILIIRLGFYAIIQKFGRHGRKSCDILFVGSSLNMVDLYKELIEDSITRYRFLGYFDNESSIIYKGSIPYLGAIDSIPNYIKSLPFHFVGRIYCCLPPVEECEIEKIVDYCENHLIRFYSVPNIDNCLQHSMKMEIIGNVPVFFFSRKVYNTSLH